MMTGDPPHPYQKELRDESFVVAGSFSISEMENQSSDMAQVTGPSHTTRLWIHLKLSLVSKNPERERCKKLNELSKSI